MPYKIEVTTNNVPREVLNGWDLTPAERARFDYLDWAAIEEGRDSASFFRYRGEVYYLGDVMRWVAQAPEGMNRWHGYASDSMSTGIVVRYVWSEYDEERLIVGYYRMVWVDELAA